MVRLFCVVRRSCAPDANTPGNNARTCAGASTASANGKGVASERQRISPNRGGGGLGQGPAFSQCVFSSFHTPNVLYSALGQIPTQLMMRVAELPLVLGDLALPLGGRQRCAESTYDAFETGSCTGVLNTHGAACGPNSCKPPSLRHNTSPVNGRNNTTPAAQHAPDPGMKLRPTCRLHCAG